MDIKKKNAKSIKLTPAGQKLFKKDEAGPEKVKTSFLLDKQVYSSFKNACRENGWNVGEAVEKLMRGTYEE